jgi:methionyl-tRNA formyltransferase
MASDLKGPQKMRVVMMGTGLFAEPTYEALLAGRHSVAGLVTQPDRAVGQERGSTRQTGKGMKTIALEHGIPVFQPVSINTPEGVTGLQEMRPELLVVAAYGQILSRDVLAVPPRGGINVHASLLPKYRGAAPIAWAIAAGETQTGVTIIRMSVSLDAGDMLAQEAVDIGADETTGEVEARLAPLGARLALRVMDEIEAGTIQGHKQDAAQVTKAPKLKKEHGAIDWARPAAAVWNHIRAMQPWPTAYTFWHRAGKPPLRLLVLKAMRFPVKYDPAVPPGTPFDDPRFPGSLFVTAGPAGPDEREVVQILELQPAGKRRMAAAEFLRGHRPAAGDRLGPES